MWICDNCGEELPNTVFVCWQCNTPKGGGDVVNERNTCETETCVQCGLGKVVYLAEKKRLQ